MPDGHNIETYFLQDSSPEQLEEAVALNHHTWMTTKARAGGGRIHEGKGVTWVFTPGRDSEGMILFPRLTGANADTQLDEIIHFYRKYRPEKLVGCWSLYPPQPSDLEIRLLARGFQQGWRPHWMWLDLQQMQIIPPKPEKLRIELIEGPTEWDVDDLPYYDEVSESIRLAATRLTPQRIWHFGAWLDGRPVGHSAICMTTGALGIAGIYDVGVVPGARNQGIGKAITIAACSHGQKMGCRYAMLNGTGDRMYLQIGFETISYGRTWWLNIARLEANPPTPTIVTFAEAVGRGDIDSLENLEEQIDSESYEAPLTNGMTPIELAVKLGKSASAEWLTYHGATLDVLSAWDLGWKDRAVALLDSNPELINRRSGELKTTPLHIAAERGDAELARLLLTANPDLNIKDTMFNHTPLGWAKHNQRKEIIDLIEAHCS